MKTKIGATIVADSTNIQGDRLISMVLTYPRIIHAELLTHRMLSRNASSSRAVPVQKMIEAVRNNTFCPFEFQKAHTGMQGSEYFTDKDKQDCVNLWLESAELALQQAEKMQKKGISKQIINRILEPYQYYKVLITGSAEGFKNMFDLRCPSFDFNDVNDTIYKSKKDVLRFVGGNEYLPKFEKSLNEFTDLDWLSINKGQAEIHFMDLAEKMWDAYNESTPKRLKAGEWHLPMLPKEMEGFDINNKLAYCVGVHANTSYTIVGENKELTLVQAVNIHNKCKELKHSSVFEHCCRAMSDEEYYTAVKTVKGLNREKAIVQKDLGWCNNIKGFIPYRYMIDNNIEV